jgi:UDP-N-acetylmuramate--alanine ligase
MAKTDLDDFKNRSIHFIGCGGAGMAPLAMIMMEKGFNVSGSDMAESSRTAMLAERGANINIGHSVSNLDGLEEPLVVYSSAIKDSNPELAAVRKRYWKCVSRGQMLADLADTYKRTVSISGSHGKTTVTAMLAHIMKCAGIDVGYMVGGQIKGMPSWAAGNGDIFICEVDESDGSHTLMNSHLGVITNVEDDHCWSVGGAEQLKLNFKTYASKAPKIIFLDDEELKELFHDNPDKEILKPDDIFDRNYFEGLNQDILNTWGDFQLIDAAFAVEAAVELGVSFDAALKSLNSFPGVARRMSVHMDTPRFFLIEDYAHHPTEVKVVLESLRKRFPGRELNVLFQPHRYARLEHYINDFAKVLSIADKILVLPVFTAWTDSSKVDSATLAKKIGRNAKSLDSHDWAKIAAYSLRQCNAPAVLAVLGAGDVNEVIPEMLTRLK